MPQKTAIILTNLGTPDELNRHSVIHFLRQFLSDPMVVDLPRFFWLPLLNGLILPLRASKTLAAYSRVWSNTGSPLMAYSLKQQTALQKNLGDQARVVLAMRYGKPSFASLLKQLRDDGIEKLLLLPLYPQYSTTTTATSECHLKHCLRDLNYAPQFECIHDYHQHPSYIKALAESVRQHRSPDPQARHLLMSFHGLPQKNIDKGDPYQGQCETSARLLAKELGLDDSQWSLGYQSRFGKQQWIEPSTIDLMQKFATENISAIDVICPGFSVDCLETLDEIEVRYKQQFIEFGGKQLNYIPALNDDDLHIQMMSELIKPLL